MAGSIFRLSVRLALRASLVVYISRGWPVSRRRLLPTSLLISDSRHNGTGDSAAIMRRCWDERRSRNVTLRDSGIFRNLTRNTLDCNQSNYSSRIVFSHTLIEFGPTRNSAIRMDDPSRRYRHLNFPRWRPSRHLGFGQTGNSAIRSADLENPTVEPNT